MQTQQPHSQAGRVGTKLRAAALMGAAAAGAVQGKVALSSSVLEWCVRHAAAYFSAAQREEFCGNAVYVDSVPDWMPLTETWFPVTALAALGYERAPGEKFQLLATVGVDAHTDHIHGPVFILVLSNDYLKFRQGRNSHETLPGEWFVFDDRLLHSVSSSHKKATTYLCISVGLSSVGRAGVR